MPLQAFGACRLHSHNTNVLLSDTYTPFASHIGSTVAFTGYAEDLGFKAELKAFISTIDKDLAEADDEVKALEMLLRIAQVKQAAARAFRDAHVAILPPIHSLPPEIISRIFIMLVPVAECVILPAKITTAPWNVITVCRSWRQIAFSLPCLWSPFRVEAIDKKKPFTPILHPGGLSSEVAQHLDLSGHGPLSFSIEVSENNVSQIPFSKLFRLARRWEDVAFDGSAHVYDSFPTFKADDLTSLSRLSVKVSAAFRGNPYTLDVLTKFASAPHLRHLTISFPSADSVPDLSTIRFMSRLSSLNIDFTTCPRKAAAGSYHFLAVCPNLNSFAQVHWLFLERHAMEIRVVGIPPIIHEHLRVLKLLDTLILSHLQCPNLQHLDLPMIGSQQTAEFVVDFCRRSSSDQLKKADVRIHHQEPAHLLTILPVLTLVENLGIDATQSMDNLLHTLMFLAASPKALPRLHWLSIQLDVKFITTLSAEASANFLVQSLAKRAQTTPLRRVHVDLNHAGRVYFLGQVEDAAVRKFEDVLRGSMPALLQLTVGKSVCADLARIIGE